jgi:CheY-like chemotaxis protein
MVPTLILHEPAAANRSQEWLASPALYPRRIPSPRPTSSKPGERLQCKRILIAEDESLLAEELQMIFEDEGARVLGPALSLLEALETVAHAPKIDIAVLDVDLDGEDVYPIAELLLQRGVPFLFLTGYGSQADLTMLFPDVVTLAKPMRPDALIEQLLGLLP